MTPPDPRRYRLPAEWEPHAATWLAWPHRRRTWLGPFEPIPLVYEQLARLIAAHEPVRIIGSQSLLAEPRERLAGVANVEFVPIPTNDSWVRDTGPVFLLRRGEASADAPPRAAVAWEWNAWGGKYPPWDDDGRVSRSIATHLGLAPPVPPNDSFGARLPLAGTRLTTIARTDGASSERCSHSRK